MLDENHRELTRAKGVGPKLAQKIILELKDKLTSYKGENVTTTSSSGVTVPKSQNIEDAQMVLLSLGYEKDEVATALTKSVAKLSKDAPAEDILKDSLRILSL